MKKISIISLVFALAFLVSCGSKVSFDGFSDKNFIECIKKTEKKLEEITELNCANTEQSLKDNPFGETLIHNIAGAEKLVNLRKLDLKKNKIEDISPLSGLTSLEYLDLGENEIRSMYPLEHLTNLTYQFIYHIVIYSSFSNSSFCFSMID